MSKCSLPYYIINTDNGFLCAHLYSKSNLTKPQYALHTDEGFEQYSSWYKNNYKDKKEEWKPCVKTKHYYPSGLIRRKSKESLERLIEKMKNGEIRNPERFPNPRIIEVTIPFMKYFSLLENNNNTVDYNIWGW